MLQASGAAGGQTVPQRHLHGLPRHASDGDELNPPRKEPSIERLRQGVARLHAVPCGA